MLSFPLRMLLRPELLDYLRRRRGGPFVRLAREKLVWACSVFDMNDPLDEADGAYAEFAVHLKPDTPANRTTAGNRRSSIYPFGDPPMAAGKLWRNPKAMRLHLHCRCRHGNGWRSRKVSGGRHFERDGPPWTPPAAPPDCGDGVVRTATHRKQILSWRYRRIYEIPAKATTAAFNAGLGILTWKVGLLADKLDD